MKRKIILAAAVVLAGIIGGCGSTYTTPVGRADFAKIGLSPEQVKTMSDGTVHEVSSKKPMAVFPATLAVVRVQARGDRYNNYGAREGNFGVVTLRDVEKDDDFKKLLDLPQVSGLATMKQILLPHELNSDMELREAAAKLHAGLLLYYTFDTEFQTDEKLPPLSTITLGAFPNHEATVVTTASAVLMDVNNGYVYGVYEATSKKKQLANAWTSSEAMEQVRKKADREAFEGLMQQFGKGWVNVVIEYKK